MYYFLWHHMTWFKPCISLIAHFFMTSYDLVWPAQWLKCTVPALRSEGREFDPRPSHTKDYKNGTRCLPAWHWAIRGWIGGKALRHTGVMSRGCACMLSCLTLQIQDIGSCVYGSICRQRHGPRTRSQDLLTYLLYRIRRFCKVLV